MADDAEVAIGRLVETAHALADVSGGVILPYFRRPLVVDNKAAAGEFDPVTVADREAEQAIRARLAVLHPEHGILGEEMGRTEGMSPYTWVIDPIDGTRAFITGMPLWGTLIGVTHASRAVVGLMDQPYTRERIWSEAETSVWRGSNGIVRPIRASGCRDLAEARLTTTSPDLFTQSHEQAAFARLRAGARMTRFGGDCYAYCLLAAGHIDLIVEAGLKPYDIVALVPIIERAGGVVTAWDGSRPENGGRIVASAGPHLHDAVLEAIAGA